MYGCTARSADRFKGPPDPPFYDESGACSIVTEAGFDRQSRDSCDAGESLAAKPQGCNVRKISCRSQFAGSVPRDREFDVFKLHATSVVRDMYGMSAALHDVDDDGACAGVDGVFNQFLYHRRGTFDHLSRGDL